MTDLIELLTLDRLLGEQRALAETIGLEAYKKLLRAYSGLVIYIPAACKLTIPLRDELIRQEYSGYNTRELAIKWGLTESWIRTIVAAERQALKYKPCDGQLSLFG